VNRSLHVLLVIVVGLSLSAGCIGQNWTPGTTYKVGDSAVKKVLVGVVNDEANPDAFVLDQMNLWLLRGDGKGSFIDPSTLWHSNVKDIALGKFNKGDSTQKVLALVQNSSGQTAGLYILDSPSSSTGAMTPVEGEQQLGITCSIGSGDFNGDGLDDIAVGCKDESSLLIGINQGSATFQFSKVGLISGQNFQKLVVGDFDGDGNSDLQVLLSEPSGRLSRYALWSIGDGTFRLQNLETSDSDTDIAAGDFDGDKSVDFVGVRNNVIVPFKSNGIHQGFESLKAISAEDGCSVDAVGVVSTWRAFLAIRAKDLLVAESCNGNHVLKQLINRAATKTSASLKMDRNNSQLKSTLHITVQSISGGPVPEGKVLIGYDGKFTDSVDLTDGTADYRFSTPENDPRINLLYVSSNALAVSTYSLRSRSPKQSSYSNKLPRWGARPAQLLSSTYRRQTSAHLMAASSSITERPPDISISVSPTSINAGSIISIEGTTVSTIQTLLWGDTGGTCADQADPQAYGTVWVYVDGSPYKSLPTATNKNYLTEACGDYDPDEGVTNESYIVEIDDIYDTSISDLTPGTHNIQMYYAANGTIVNTDYKYGSVYSDPEAVTVAGKSSPSLSLSCSPSSTTYGSVSVSCTPSLSGGSSPTGSMAWGYSQSGSCTPGSWLSGYGLSQSVGDWSGYSAGAITVCAQYSGDSSNNTALATTSFTIQKATPTVSINTGAEIAQWDMVNSGVSHSVGAANNGNWTVTSGNSGTMQYGPYTTSVNAGGINVATWSLMIDDNSSDNSAIAHIDVTDNVGQIVIAKADITRKQFTGANTLQTFSLPFTAPASPVGLEFRVGYSGNSTLTESLVSVGGQTSAVYGHPVTLVATVGLAGGGVPTGSVTFYNAGAPIGTAPIDTSLATATLTVSNLAIGTNALSASYSGDNNYQSASSDNLNQVITKGTPTLTASCSPTPVMYGEKYSCTAKLSGSATGTITWPDAIGGNSSTLNNSETTTGALTATRTGTYTGTVSYSGDSNNETVSTTVSLTVSKAQVTVTANDASMTYGSATPSLTASYSGFANGDTASVISGSPALATAATSGSSVGSYPISCDTGSLSATNYTFVCVNGTLTIGAASLTITPTAQSKIYGSTLSIPTTAFSSVGLKNTDSISGVIMSSPGTAATSSAGSYTISAADAAGSGLSNYSIVYNTGALTVTKAVLTVTANDASMAYGAAVPGLTAGYGGFLNGDSVAVITGNPTLTTSATSSSPIGSYAISCDAAPLSATNYTFTCANGTLTVGAATLTITPAAQSKVYGSALSLPATAFTSSGLKNSDSISNVVMTSPGTSSTAPTGSYTISASGATGSGLNNYLIVYNSGTLTVGKAPLTVTASSASVSYGAAAPVITPTYSGWKNGDTATSLTVAPSCSTVYAALSPTGTYSTSCSGAASENYSISYVAGSVTVEAAGVTITTTSTVNPSTYGQTVTWTFSVASSSGSGPTPTGSLTLTAGGNTLGTFPLNNGVATYTSGVLPTGTNTIAATYSGDSLYH